MVGGGVWLMVDSWLLIGCSHQRLQALCGGGGGACVVGGVEELLVLLGSDQTEQRAVQELDLVLKPPRPPLNTPSTSTS